MRASSRLDVISVRLFAQAPVTPLELYHRRLRGQGARIRQVATQTNDENRSVEMQTDEVGREGTVVYLSRGFSMRPKWSEMVHSYSFWLLV